MGRNRGKHSSAVGAGFAIAAAAGTGHGDEDVDDTHEGAAEDAGLYRVFGNSPWSLDAKLADDVDDDDAKGKAGQGVHRVIAIQQALQYGGLLVSACGGKGGDGGGRMGEGREQQDAEYDEEDRCEDLARPSQYLAGAQGEPQSCRHKGQREQQQSQLFVAACWQQGLGTNLEGHCHTTGAGKEWPDGQIECTSEDVAEVAASFLAEIKQTIASRDAERCNGHHRHADACDQEAEEGRIDVAAGFLSQIGGENQVSGTKEEAEQHTGNRKCLTPGEFCFHCLFLLDILY